MTSQERSIRVKAMARVEGEGGLHIRMRDGQLAEVRLSIFEPPRLFEAFLRGRRLEEVPDITARICGICPVAYQMSSAHAIEAALGIRVSPEVRRLRRLLYCGEWIESHSLHVHLLHLPDFLGYESALTMSRDFRDELNRGLQLKKYGNELLEVLGGRAIHPVNVAIGGFYRFPPASAFESLVPKFEWGFQAAIDTTRWVAGLSFPAFERDYDFVAVSHPDEYAMCEGDIRTSDGMLLKVDEFENHFREQQVPHSTALQAVRVDRGRSYFLGPLARVNLNREQLSSTTQRLADEIGFEQPCRNPYKSIIARCLEIVQSYEEALSILKDLALSGPPRVSYSVRPGQGASATEAPRGLLYHRYVIDENDRVALANIVPPTSQNQGQIEDDLWAVLSSMLDEDDDQIAGACERLVRSYDPCISCSTHFLKVNVERT